jgi:hypothetical protein
MSINSANRRGFYITFNFILNTETEPTQDVVLAIQEFKRRADQPGLYL